MNINKYRKGFTLIELLIVIVIIGILAAAVITAINPVEQIKKANDSAKITTANELVNAVNVYYVSQGSYPWVGTGNGPVPNAPGGAATAVAGSGMLSVLGASEDIKETIANRDYTGLNMWLGTDGGIMVCYVPDSVSYQTKIAYNDTAGTSGTLTQICVK